MNWSRILKDGTMAVHRVRSDQLMPALHLWLQVHMKTDAGFLHVWWRPEGSRIPEYTPVSVKEKARR